MSYMYLSMNWNDIIVYYHNILAECVTQEKVKECIYILIALIITFFVELLQLFAFFVQWQFIEDEEKSPYTSPVLH